MKQVEVPILAHFGSEHQFPRGGVLVEPVSRFVEVSWSLFRQVGDMLRFTSTIPSSGPPLFLVSEGVFQLWASTSSGAFALRDALEDH